MNKSQRVRLRSVHAPAGSGMKKEGQLTETTVAPYGKNKELLC